MSPVKGLLFEVSPDYLAESKIQRRKLVPVPKEVFVRPVDIAIERRQGQLPVGNHVVFKKFNGFFILEQDDIGPVTVHFEQQGEGIIKADGKTSFIF